MTEPLGTYGETVGHSRVDPATGEVLPLEVASLTPEQKRSRKYSRARSMAKLLQHKDLAGCHAWVQAKSSPVVVNVKRAAYRSGFFTNIQTCGMVHLCAHCQPKIGARRAKEIQTAMDAWKAEGGDVLMVTLTLSHGRTDPLAETLSALKDAGRRFAQHRAFKGLSASVGLAGRIVATEYTHGVNGWHPHQHQLWFVRSGVDQAAMKSALDSAWRASLLKSGFTSSDAHGVKVNGGERAAKYVAKMSSGEAWTLADEVARSSSKVGRNGSRSIWQILDTWSDRLASESERGSAARLLREYSACVTGTKALTWSPGLKKRFGLVDLADAKIAEEAQEDDTIPVAFVEPSVWPIVVRHRAQAELLTAAEDRGSAGVADLVRDLQACSVDRCSRADLAQAPRGAGAVSDPGAPDRPDPSRVNDQAAQLAPS